MYIVISVIILCIPVMGIFVYIVISVTILCILVTGNIYDPAHVQIQGNMTLNIQGDIRDVINKDRWPT